MASRRPYDPVMHCSSKENNAVNTLAQRVLSTGIYANPIVFVNPPVAQDDFATEASLLKTFISQAVGNTKMKKLRNNQCKIVFGLLVKLLLFVKVTANHNVKIINLSGFDLNNQPMKSQAPEQPTIKKVVEGKESGTYKVYLTRKLNKPDVAKGQRTHPRDIKYSIEITTTPDDESSWKIVQHSVPSTKLVFSEITLGMKNYIRVFGINASGKGQSSMIYAFSPQ